MKLSSSVVFVALVACVVAVSLQPRELPETFESIVQQVNSAKTTWTAALPPHFNSTEDVKKLCGTWTKGHPKYVKLPELETGLRVLSASELPATFDARTQWPQCSVISRIRDQSSCGSCWAVSSTESFEDRRCVQLGKDIEYASEDTVACCKGLECGFSEGCNGGQPSAAWDWFVKTGVVTGGDYPDIGSGSSCLPYSMAPCAHHVPPTPKYPACPSDEYPTPSCSKTCSESKYATPYSSDKTKAAKAGSITGVEKIMTEVMTNGPVVVAFTVYSDFPTYKSGVYKHTTGSELGGHAVELIGWGTENGVDYWLIKNSWNEMWGDGGCFKIVRGVDECGIEDDVSGGVFSH